AAGIGRPSSSRRYQSTTSSTYVAGPLIATRIAFLTFAAASAATRFVKTAAYGDFDIHQITRYIVLLESRRAGFALKTVSILRPLGRWALPSQAKGGWKEALSTRAARVDKPRARERSHL